MEAVLRVAKPPMVSGASAIAPSGPPQGDPEQLQPSVAERTSARDPAAHLQNGLRSASSSRLQPAAAAAVHTRAGCAAHMRLGCRELTC